MLDVFLQPFLRVGVIRYGVVGVVSATEELFTSDCGDNTLVLDKLNVGDDRKKASSAIAADD